MYRSIEIAVNNYIGALGLFASVGVNNESASIYYVTEIFQSLIEYHIDQSHGLELIGLVCNALKEFLNHAKADRRIYNYKVSTSIENPGMFKLTVELNRLGNNVFHSEFKKVYRTKADWDHYLENLHEKYNKPLKPNDESFIEYMRTR